MRAITCQACGRPFVPESVREFRCTRCRPAGRANRSPTTRAQDAEYQRNRLLVLDGQPDCHWCEAPATTADHLMPVARGGGNELANLVPACGPCNYGRRADRRWRPPNGRDVQGPSRSEQRAPTERSPRRPLIR